MKTSAIAITVIAICLTSGNIQAQPQEVSPFKIFSELSETDREFPEMQCERLKNCGAFVVKSRVLHIEGFGNLWTKDIAYKLPNGHKAVVEVTARLHMSQELSDGGHGSELIIGFAAFKIDGWITDTESDALTFRIGCAENDVLYTAVHSRLHQKSIANTYFIMPPDQWQKVKIVLSLERRDANPEILVAAQRVRKQAQHTLVRRLEQFIPIEDSARRRANARQLAYLVMMLLDGVFVSRQVEPGDLSERQLVTIVSRAVRASLYDMLTEDTNEEVA